MNIQDLKAYWPWMPFDDGIEAADRSDFARRLCAMSEYYAAGFFEQAGAPLYVRYALALLRCAENLPLPAWNGSRLFPVSPAPPPKNWNQCEEWQAILWDWHHRDIHRHQAVYFTYPYPIFCNGELLKRKIDSVDAEDRNVLAAVDRFFRDRMTTVGGYTHCTVYYGRVLREGLNGYRRRIEEHLDGAVTEDKRVLYNSLLIVIQAAEAIQRRLIHRVETGPADDVDRKIKLLTALQQVPMEPARSFYEAILAVNILFYLDGCDSPGRMDQYLWDYYRHDRAAGRITDNDVLDLLGEFWTNMDHAGAWNVAIGGTTGPDGRSAVNELTYLILESAKNRRRPNLALRIPRDADDGLWDKALDVIATGNGLPALYNNDLYVGALKNYSLGLSDADAHDISFGGCTETMIQGCSNVGSLAANLHLLSVLERTVGQELMQSETFEDFLARYLAALAVEIGAVCNGINLDSEKKARLYPQLIRTLLVDNCIDQGTEFYRGGARYNWEVIGLEGFSNVVDSLYALKRLVFEQGTIPAQTMLHILHVNFAGHDSILSQIRALPHYGQGKSDVDQIAKRVADFTFAELRKHSAWRGGKFLGSCLMFSTYADRGKFVGATPDGRLAGEPLGDSFGAYQGRDKLGPTALLNSVTSFAHTDAPGTLVVNIRFSRDMLTQPASRKKVQSLIRTYFARGGMQIQVNVVDQKLLQDALAHPEQHENLIIRIGGFSVYFNELSQELKASVLERCIHAE